MPIVRVPGPRDHDVAIDHGTLADERSSWAARGVLAYLLGRSDDCSLNIDDLRSRGKLGRVALYEIIKDLERYGYLARGVKRDSRGRSGKSTYIVFQVPPAELLAPQERPAHQHQHLHHGATPSETPPKRPNRR